MKGTVPDGIINRRDKMGFVAPQEQWIRDNISVFLSSLSGLRETGLFENVYLDRIKQDAAKNTLDFSQLMRLYVFSVWLKVFNVRRFNV